MKLTKLAALVFSLSLAGASAAAAASVTGAAALALAGVVAQYAPLPAANEHAVAAFFKGDTNFPTRARFRSPRTRSSAGPAMSTSRHAPAR